MRVTAVAPATTANLGPGFDALGAAVAVHLKVHVDTDAPGRWSFSGPDDDPPPPGLILNAVRAAAGEAVEVGLAVETEIPLGRGLGSSASAIAAGLLAGCALAGRAPDPAELMRIGLPLEGHPDNLAAALYGGLTLVVAGEVLRFDPSPSVRPAILVPDTQLATSEARAALPDQVPMADAVSNLARTAGLLALLTGATEPAADLLLACTEDRIHQPYRGPLMPETHGLVEDLREAGVAAYVSGAGPSVGCLLVDETGPAFEARTEGLPRWKVLDTRWDLRGARVLEG